jgi:hypothetical protein
VASLLFGAHFLPRGLAWERTQSHGVRLGALYDWTGQLVAPIAAHVLVNGISLPRLERLPASSRSSRGRRVDLDRAPSGGARRGALGRDLGKVW